MDLSIFKKLKLTLYFLFFRNKFIDIATEDSIEKSFEHNKQLREKYPDKKLPKEEWQERRRGREKATTELRQSISSAFLCVLVTVLIAAIIAFIVKRQLGLEIGANTLLVIRLSGLFFIVWAIFSKLGWKIQTIGGETLPEIINQFWFRLLYTVGAFLLFFGLFCDSF